METNGIVFLGFQMRELQKEYGKGCDMVDTDRLNKIIDESGLKRQYLADKIGLSRQSMYEKINNQSEFTVRQVKILCDLLGIKKLTDKEQIFFDS